MQRYKTSGRGPSLLSSKVNANVDWFHSNATSSAKALGTESWETQGEDVQEFINWFLVFFRYRTCYAQSSYGLHNLHRTIPPSTVLSANSLKKWNSMTNLNMNNLVPAWWDWSGLTFLTALSVFRVTVGDGRSSPGWVASLLQSPKWAYVVMVPGTYYQNTFHVFSGTGIKNPLLLSLVPTSWAPLNLNWTLYFHLLVLQSP